MADRGWWFNRSGVIAPVSNPGSNIPNYGLTTDIALSPVEDKNYTDLAAAIEAAAAAYKEPEGEKTLWDRLVGAKDAVVSTAQAGLGAVAYGVTSLDDLLGTDTEDSREVQEAADAAEAEGLSGFRKFEKIGEATLGGTIEEETQPGSTGEKVTQALDTVYRNVSAGFLFASLSQEDEGFDKLGERWAQAKEMSGDFNPGQAFMTLALDKEILDDEERLEQIRQHNTLFNMSALAFNTIAAWKYDPTVLAGKAAGQAGNVAAGRLATQGRSQVIQRDILSQPTRQDALASARQYTGIADRVRARYGVSLYDKSLGLREAAKTMGFEDFKNLSPFQNSASGVTMARLMQEAAHNDGDWNLVFRTAIGDPTATGELVLKRGEYADKIEAIEARSLPSLEKRLDRVQQRYEKRLADQGRDADAGLEITRYGDWLLDNDFQTLKADVEDARLRLQEYEGYNSWLERALPGLDVETGAVNNRAANSVYGNLEQVRVGSDALRSAGRDVRGSLYSLGGKVTTWRHDDYSPVARMFRAPAKPFLKRVGVVSLNDVDEGAGAIQSYLDQIVYVTGRHNQQARDGVLERWASATTDLERRDVVQTLERQGIAMLGKKWGIDGDTMNDIATELQAKRGQSWAKLSDRSMYTTVKDPKTGKSLDLFPITDEATGHVDYVRLPVDVSELPNWHPMANLTDLDKTLRQNRDLFQELSKAKQAGLWSERHANQLYNFVGETLNSLWKPAALISLRWPARVVADESFRIMLMMGVLPHMKAWGEGVKNTVYNNGVTRPREWWNGRQVKTGSLVEDSLRAMTHQFDPWDTRAVSNPTGAAPVRVLDFDQIDQRRYSRLNSEVSRRQAETRTLAYYKGTARTKWQQQWDDRLAAAEAGDSRGFFFDPVTGKAANKGFAVSVYPGRLKTFGAKPTAKEMNFFLEKNSDLLAIKRNRVAVWHDKDTGRWHMDVTKVARTRDDAMALATEAEAPDFFDIADGFTRYVADEDPYGHRAGASVFETGGFDKITTEAVEIPDAYLERAPKKGIGFGKRTWRSGDGRAVEGEGVYGLDKRDPNIYYSTTSSQGAFQGLLGGHTRALGQNRARRTTRGYRPYHPDPTNPKSIENRQWADAWAHYVNNHIRQSPIWLRMLNGDADDQIEAWMRSKGGRDLRRRLGPRGMDPHKYVTEMRAIFDHTLPTPQSRAAVLAGEVDPRKVDDILPLEFRNDVHGEAIELTAGVHDAQKMWFSFVDRAYKMLGSVPTDTLVRHPFASNVYDLRLKNYLASVPADQITPQVMAAAEASARAFAVKQTRRLLYNIADELEGVHMLRFLSPFFQAQLEVMERYAHIWTRKPESFARTLLLFQGSQTASVPGVFEVVDKDGNPAKEYDHDNQVILQVTPFMRKIADQIPGLKGALDNAGSMSVPVASINLILQGEKPYLPSAGPLVSIPASEFYFRDRPWESETFIYEWLYPFGTPDGDSALSRSGKALSPAWMRRLHTAIRGDFNDSAFATRADYIYRDMLLAYKNGKREEPPTEVEALEAAKNEYMLRALSSFALPVPLTPRSPHQFWIDQSRKYKEKYGIDGPERFYEDFGPDAFLFYTESTKSTNGLAPTSAQARGYVRNKKLIDQAPDLAGVLAGPFGSKGEFNDAVYQWQLEERRSPLSNRTMRERQDPSDRIREVEIDRGWIEYGKLSAAVDTELRNRGLTSLEQRGAEDLKYWRDQEVEGIISRNKAFSDAYQSRQQRLGGWLQQAYGVAFDPSLNGRTDIEGLRAYLISRARMQDTLQERQAAGLSESDNLSANANADLKAAWDNYLMELTSKNLLFAEVYHRYLENDDLSVFIASEG